MAALLPDIAKVEAAIIEITNTVRVQEKLGPVVISPQLTQAARAYAALLAQSGAFSHEADGTISDRVKRTGYAHCLIAENLALHQDSRGFETRALAKSAMEGWLNSPGHRANLMLPDVTEIGVGVAKAADATPKYIAVQVFGRPQSKAITFQVSNATGEPATFAYAGKSHDLKPHMAFTMQSCSGGDVRIDGKGVKPFSARYEAADGKTYTLTAPAGGLRVDIGERQTVK